MLRRRNPTGLFEDALAFLRSFEDASHPLDDRPDGLDNGPRYFSDGPDDLDDGSDGLASRPPGAPHKGPNTSCESNYPDTAQRLT